MGTYKTIEFETTEALREAINADLAALAYPYQVKHRINGLGQLVDIKAPLNGGSLYLTVDFDLIGTKILALDVLLSRRLLDMPEALMEVLLEAQTSFMEDYVTREQAKMEASRLAREQAQAAAKQAEAAKKAEEAYQKTKAKAIKDFTVLCETPLKFWVGTQAEYDAIPTKDGTMFYIISDDTTEANFDEAIQDVKDAQQEIKDTNDKIVETFESYAPQDITSQLLDVNSSFAGSLQLIKSGKVFNLSLFKTGLQLFMRNGKGGTSLWDLCKLPEEIRPNKAIYIVPHIDLHPTYGELSRNKGNWIRINLDGTVQFLINFEISSSYDYVYFESVAFNTTYIV